jgi:hypothetical protein
MAPIARITAGFFGSTTEDRTIAFRQAPTTALLAVGRVATDQDLPGRCGGPGGRDGLADQASHLKPRVVQAGGCTHSGEGRSRT